VALNNDDLRVRGAATLSENGGIFGQTGREHNMAMEIKGENRLRLPSSSPEHLVPPLRIEVNFVFPLDLKLTHYSDPVGIE
jgi:hypothetical protein